MFACRPKPLTILIPEKLSMNCCNSLVKVAFLMMTAANLFTAQTQADPIVATLTLPSGVDVDALTVGQNLTFTLSLNGFSGGEELSLLTMGVRFEGGFLQDYNSLFELTSSSPGSIIEPSSFQSSIQSSEYNTTYEFTGGSITQDGTFATFTLTALQAGSGDFGIGILIFSSDGPSVTPTGGLTDFTILPPGVPEPSSLMLSGTAIVFGLGYSGVRIRRRRAK